MKRISKAVVNKVSYINEQLLTVNRLDLIPTAYNGCTMPSEFMLKNAIEFNDKFVWINWEKSRYNYTQGMQRFTLSNEWHVEELNYILRIIKNTFKKSIKNNI
tara:strand:+ start:59 stop:367 length:309 start_codon:yes stop_codon:yes gene_type:complete